MTGVVCVPNSLLTAQAGHNNMICVNEAVTTGSFEPRLRYPEIPQWYDTAESLRQAIQDTLNGPDCFLPGA